MSRFVQRPQAIEHGSGFKQSDGGVGGHGCAEQEKYAERNETPWAPLVVRVEHWHHSLLGGLGRPSFRCLLLVRPASFARTVASFTYASDPNSVAPPPIHGETRIRRCPRQHRGRSPCWPGFAASRPQASSL